MTTTKWDHETPPYCDDLSPETRTHPVSVQRTTPGVSRPVEVGHHYSEEKGYYAIKEIGKEKTEEGVDGTEDRVCENWSQV